MLRAMCAQRARARRRAREPGRNRTPCKPAARSQTRPGATSGSASRPSAALDPTRRLRQARVRAFEFPIPSAGAGRHGADRGDRRGDGAGASL